MSSEAVPGSISIRGLGKQYRLGGRGERYLRLTDVLWRRLRGEQDRHRTGLFWALRDATFDVAPGEVLGVIGPNGAGKSTLLKILARITDPTEGVAVVGGRIGSLLEVGTGFHPELSGRDNIFLSGAILGLSRADIRRRFDEIVDFAEVDRFLDTPVKRYSSGMKVRLGFAVAAHLEPEILVVDEVLAVGDAAFQQKSLGKMRDVASGGRTIMFVSHNMAAVEHLCSRAILLAEGRIVASGGVSDTVDEYLLRSHQPGATSLASREDRRGDGRLRFLGLEADLRTGLPGRITIDYEATEELPAGEISVGIFSLLGEGVAFLGSAIVGAAFPVMPRRGTFVCTLPLVSLRPGRYTVNVFCTSAGAIVDWIVNAADVEVREGDFFGTGRLPPDGYGLTLTMHSWSLESA